MYLLYLCLINRLMDWLIQSTRCFPLTIFCGMCLSTACLIVSFRNALLSSKLYSSLMSFSLSVSVLSILALHCPCLYTVPFFLHTVLWHVCWQLWWAWWLSMPMCTSCFVKNYRQAKCFTCPGLFFHGRFNIVFLMYFKHLFIDDLTVLGIQWSLRFPSLYSVGWSLHLGLGCYEV